MPSSGLVATLPPPESAHWRALIESLGYKLEEDSQLENEPSSLPNDLFLGSLIDEEGRYPCHVSRRRGDVVHIMMFCSPEQRERLKPNFSTVFAISDR